MSGAESSTGAELSNLKPPNNIGDLDFNGFVNTFTGHLRPYVEPVFSLLFRTFSPYRRVDVIDIKKALWLCLHYYGFKLSCFPDKKPKELWEESYEELDKLWKETLEDTSAMYRHLHTISDTVFGFLTSQM